MHCKGRCMVLWARCPPKPMWLQTNSALLWSDGVCTASGRLAFLVSIELADQCHWEFPTKTFRCYFPEQCLHCLRPRGDVHLCHNPRKVLTLWMLKEQRWVAAADSSDRTLTEVKLRNIFLLAALQSSLTKHHSGTSKRGSRLRNHNTSRQCFGHKVFRGTILQLVHSQLPLNTPEESVPRLPMPATSSGGSGGSRADFWKNLCQISQHRDLRKENESQRQRLSTWYSEHINICQEFPLPPP